MTRILRNSYAVDVRKAVMAAAMRRQLSIVAFRIREGRSALRFSQAELAARAGVSRSFVQRLESGGTNFTVVSGEGLGSPFQRVVEALGLTLKAVFVPPTAH